MTVKLGFNFESFLTTMCKRVNYFGCVNFTSNLIFNFSSQVILLLTSVQSHNKLTSTTSDTAYPVP